MYHFFVGPSLCITNHKENLLGGTNSFAGQFLQPCPVLSSRSIQHMQTVLILKQVLILYLFCGTMSFFTAQETQEENLLGRNNSHLDKFFHYTPISYSMGPFGGMYAKSFLGPPQTRHLHVVVDNYSLSTIKCFWRPKNIICGTGYQQLQVNAKILLSQWLAVSLLKKGNCKVVKNYKFTILLSTTYLSFLTIDNSLFVVHNFYLPITNTCEQLNISCPWRPFTSLLFCQPRFEKFPLTSLTTSQYFLLPNW